MADKEELDPATIALNALTQHIKTLTRIQNPKPFTTKFTGDHAETLKWCHDVDMYLDTNLLEDDYLTFRRIFPSLPSGVQTLYMQDIRAIDGADAAKRKNAKYTIAELKKWVVKEYPPIQSRVDFIKRMKRIRVRRDEDPVIVWNKLRAMMEEVDTAIETINASVPPAKKMPTLADIDRWEICCSIFITNDNQQHFQNNGKINAATVKYVISQDPQTLDDFKTIFTNIHSKIAPKCTRGSR